MNSGSTSITYNVPTALPPGFDELEPFVAYWVRETCDERWDQRARASMAEIRRFYDAMLARAEDALAYLDQYPLGDDVPSDAKALALMLLALGQVAIAVEMHGAPRAPYSPFPHRIHMIAGPWPFG